MDDHVHVILRLAENRHLHEVVHSWKSFTAHAMTRNRTRNAPVWEDEYWDRIIRNEAEFAEKVVYVLNNPQKRWPDVSDYSWLKAYCIGE
jgi:REP element-mobilizing transposase RayT